jgi:hypothetical protein
MRLVVACNYIWEYLKLQDQVSTILYINSISQSVYRGRYILNMCEKGVVFVFNVPSWMSFALSISQ